MSDKENLSPDKSSLRRDKSSKRVLCITSSKGGIKEKSKSGDDGISRYVKRSRRVSEKGEKFMKEQLKKKQKPTVDTPLPVEADERSHLQH